MLKILFYTPIIAVIIYIVLLLTKTYLPNYHIYATYYKKTINVLFISTVFAYGSFLLSLIFIWEFEDRQPKFKCYIKLIMLSITATFMLINFSSNFYSTINCFLDIKYVFTNEPKIATEVFLPVTEYGVEHSSRTSSYTEHRVIFETENLKFDICDDDGTMDKYYNQDSSGKVINILYLPNSNIFISLRYTDKRISKKRALDLKAKKLANRLHTRTFLIYNIYNFVGQFFGRSLDRTADEYFTLASCYAKIGDYDSAVRQCSYLIDDLHNSNNVTLYNRALFYKDKGDYNKALNDLKNAVKPSSSNIFEYIYKSINNLGYSSSNNTEDIYKLTADIYYKLEDYNKALANYKLAPCAMEYGSLDEVNNMKYILERKKILDIQAKKLSKSSGNDMVERYLNLAKKYCDNDCFNIGIKYYNKLIIDMGIKTSKTLYWRGTYYYRKGDYKKAIVDYSEGLKIALPNDNSSYYYELNKGLRNCYKEEKGYKNALK